jgi:hypothetical protein
MNLIIFSIRKQSNKAKCSTCRGVNISATSVAKRSFVNKKKMFRKSKFVENKKLRNYLLI